MIEKYVWMIDFKRGKWKEFCSLQPAESEEIAQAYIEHFAAGVRIAWFRTKSDGYNALYGRRIWPDKTVTTYRITRQSLITQQEVDMYRQAEEGIKARENNRS